MFRRLCPSLASNATAGVYHGYRETIHDPLRRTLPDGMSSAIVNPGLGNERCPSLAPKS